MAGGADPPAIRRRAIGPRFAVTEPHPRKECDDARGRGAGDGRRRRRAHARRGPVQRGVAPAGAGAAGRSRTTTGCCTWPTPPGTTGGRSARPTTSAAASGSARGSTRSSAVPSRRCTTPGAMLELCRANDIADFDLAFAYESLARSSAVAGDLAQARAWTEQALAAAADIAEDEDRGVAAGRSEKCRPVRAGGIPRNDRRPVPLRRLGAAGARPTDGVPWPWR